MDPTGLIMTVAGVAILSWLLAPSRRSSSRTRVTPGETP